MIRYEGQKFTINMPDETRIPVLVGKGEEVRLEVSKDKDGNTIAKFAGDRTDINTYLFVHAKMCIRDRASRIGGTSCVIPENKGL